MGKSGASLDHIKVDDVRIDHVRIDHVRIDQKRIEHGESYIKGSRVPQIHSGQKVFTFWQETKKISYR